MKDYKIYSHKGIIVYRVPAFLYSRMIWIPTLAYGEGGPKSYTAVQKLWYTINYNHFTYNAKPEHKLFPVVTFSRYELPYQWIPEAEFMNVKFR
jgi:hypothetical protein